MSKLLNLKTDKAENSTTWFYSRQLLMFAPCRIELVHRIQHSVKVILNKLSGTKRPQNFIKADSRLCRQFITAFKHRPRRTFKSKNEATRSSLDMSLTSSLNCFKLNREPLIGEKVNDWKYEKSMERMETVFPNYRVALNCPSFNTY